MPRAGLSPERLTVAGIELADEIGFEQVTLSELARRFDVKVASLYAHLPGQADLKQRIAVRALDEVADRAERLLDGRTGRAALEGLGDAYRTYAREHPGRYAAATSRLLVDAEAARVGARHADLARAALASYDLHGDDEVHAVRLVGSTVRGYVDLEARGGFDRSPPTAEESWQRTLDALDSVLTLASRSNRFA